MNNGLDAFKKRAPGKFAQFHQPGSTVAGTITEISDQKQATKFNPDPKAKREPDFWPSGDPVMEVWITVQTNERDQQDPEDTGLRVIVVTVNQKAGGQLAAIMDACEAVGAETPLPGGFLALSFTHHDPASKNPAQPRKLYAAKYQAPAPGGGAFQQPAAQSAPAQEQYNQWNPAPPAAAPAEPPAWAQPAAAPAPQAPAAYQPPVQVNTNTGEVHEPQQAAAPVAAPAPVAQPAPAAAPAPVAQPAPAAAPAAAPGGWDAQKVQQLIAAQMDDATISSVTGAPLQAVAAIRAIS